MKLAHRQEQDPDEGFQNDAHWMTLPANKDIAIGLVTNQRPSFKHQFENQPEFVLERDIFCLRTTGSSGGLSRVFSRKNSNFEFFERSAII